MIMAKWKIVEDKPLKKVMKKYNLSEEDVIKIVELYQLDIAFDETLKELYDG